MRLMILCNCLLAWMHVKVVSSIRFIALMHWAILFCTNHDLCQWSLGEIIYYAQFVCKFSALFLQQFKLWEEYNLIRFCHVKRCPPPSHVGCLPRFRSDLCDKKKNQCSNDKGIHMNYEENGYGQTSQHNCVFNSLKESALVGRKKTVSLKTCIS